MPATADKSYGNEWAYHVCVMWYDIDMVSVILFSACFLEGMAGISPWNLSGFIQGVEK
jgi:hypothetical protein